LSHRPSRRCHTRVSSHWKVRDTPLLREHDERRRSLLGLLVDHLGDPDVSDDGRVVSQEVDVRVDDADVLVAARRLG